MKPKLYCYRANTKIEVIDTSNAAGAGDGSTEKIASITFTTPARLNVKNTGSNYGRKDYDRAVLNISYDLEYDISAQSDSSITKDSYQDPTKGFSIGYKILGLDGNEITGSTRDNILRLTGYTEMEVPDVHYYDSTSDSWQKKSYVYYTESGNRIEYQPAGNKVEFSDYNIGYDFLDNLYPGTYQIGLYVHDIYGSNEVPYTNNNENPKIAFVVPTRSRQVVSAGVNYDINKDDPDNPIMIMSLSTKITDIAYRIGYPKNNTNERGYYDFILSRLKEGTDPADWEEIRLPENKIKTVQKSGNADWVLLQYEGVKPGEQYRIQIYAYDIGPYGRSVSSTGEEKTLLYDSESLAALKDELLIKEADYLTLGSVAGSYDKTTGNFTVTSRRGQNLDQIRKVEITVLNGRTYDFGSMKIDDIQFKGRNTVTMDLPIGGLDPIKNAGSGDFINVTIDFLDENGVSLGIPWSGSFVW